MEKKNWLEKEPESSKMPMQIAVATSIIVVFGMVVGLIVYYHGPEMRDRNDILALLNQDFITFVCSLIGFVMLEELFFRFIPIMVGVFFFRNMPATIILCLISSIIFGYLHGQAINILIQGVIGFVFCLLYLKYGGYSRKIIKPYFSVVIVHFLYNAVLFVPAYFLIHSK